MKHIFALLIFGFLITGCETTESNQTDLTKYIPRKAAVIIKTNDLAALQSDIKNNDFLQAISNTNAYSFIAGQQTLLNQIKPKGETLICFTKLGATDYEVSLISKVHKNIAKDSTLQLTQEKIAPLDSSSTYAFLVKDDILIATTSPLLLENIERATTETISKDALFDTAYQSASGSATASIFIKGSEGQTLFSDLFPGTSQNLLQNTFSWTAMDLDLDQNDLKTSGVVLTEKDSEARLNLLRNTDPQKNNITRIAPTSLQSLTAITFKDWEVFKNNKATSLKIDPSVFKMSQEDLFSTFDEIGVISLGDNSVIAAVSNDPNKTAEALTANDFKTSFRDIEIYNFTPQDDFTKTYAPLLDLPSVKMYALVDDIYVFANDQTTLESIIANYQNNATLQKSTLFQNSAQQLSDASSYLYIESLDSGLYKKRGNDASNKVLSEVNLPNYHYAAQQLVQEGDYMLLNGLITKNEDVVAAGGIAQIANVKLNAALTMSPQLVQNHRTNGMDVVTQDINNTLYLISNAGKVLWQKDLDGPIIGEMQQVDLYRNGRLQLAFTTPSSVYVLDRNGKEVGAFPLSFTDTITQPLAIFDYDSNRKYRFVIVQDDKLLMYDKNGDAVTGFTFKQAGSTVLFPPAHVRTANKDYIVVAERSGKLHILSRTGKSRIAVTKNIDFGNTPVYKNGNTFETYDVNAEKITISTKGKRTQTISEHSSDSKITITPQLKVGQRENTLHINGRKVAIPYGSYTKPTVASVQKKNYVSLTNKEASEVYIYDAKGALLPNFPVYGISAASIGHLERNKTLGFVTQGSPNSLLIYKID